MSEKLSLFLEEPFTDYPEFLIAPLNPAAGPFKDYNQQPILKKELFDWPETFDVIQSYPVRKFTAQGENTGHQMFRCFLAADYNQPSLGQIQCTFPNLLDQYKTGDFDGATVKLVEPELHLAPQRNGWYGIKLFAQDLDLIV